jgi:hypothetical protein
MQANVVDLEKGTMIAGAGPRQVDTRSDGNPGTPQAF